MYYIHIWFSSAREGNKTRDNTLALWFSGLCVTVITKIRLPCLITPKYAHVLKSPASANVTLYGSRDFAGVTKFREERQLKIAFLRIEIDIKLCDGKNAAQ